MIRPGIVALLGLVACEPEIVVAFYLDDAVQLARWEGGGWTEAARWPADGAEFVYPEIHRGPGTALVSWTSGYSSVVTRVAAWSPAAGAGEPIALSPGLVVSTACAGPAGSTLLASGTDRELSVLSFDRAGSLAGDTAIAGSEGVIRGGVACAQEGFGLVSFRRDERPWMARISR